MARFRDLGVLMEVAQAGLDFAILLPSEPAAHAAAEIARTLFESVGARPFLARLEAALAEAPAAPRSGARTEVPTS